MKRVVTGGAGFIGSNFIHYMLNKYDDEIICIDKLTYAGNLSNLKDVLKDSRLKFVRGDIVDRDFIYNLFEREEVSEVINFAAESHVDRSLSSPSEFLRTNIIGTGVLLDACREYNISRFHQVSTDEVYGDLPLDRKDLLFSEDTPLNPSSPYSSSKASADLICLAYARTYGLNVTISRCSNNYGEYQFLEKLIPLMIYNAMRDIELPVYGDGLNVRDWLYVGDHCSAIDLILKNGRGGEVYNVGGNNEKTNIEIVKIILKKLSKSEKLIRYVKDRPGHDLRYAIDGSKLKKLGWEPAMDFETGINHTINWYLNNPQWVESVANESYRDYYNAMYGDRK